MRQNMEKERNKYNIKVRQIHIQLKQLQYPVRTNSIRSRDIYNIKIFPDLICAVHLDTSGKFVASLFGKPLVVKIHGNI